MVERYQQQQYAKYACQCGQHEKILISWPKYGVCWIPHFCMFNDSLSSPFHTTVHCEFDVGVISISWYGCKCNESSAHHMLSIISISYVAYNLLSAPWSSAHPYQHGKVFVRTHQYRYVMHAMLLLQKSQRRKTHQTRDVPCRCKCRSVQIMINS